MIIGFTGTRSGMTDYQKQELRTFLDEAKHNGQITELHHGGCRGADAEFHQLCKTYFNPNMLHVWPGVNRNSPNDRSMQANLQGGVRHEEMTHFARNREIVNHSDILIAAPYSLSMDKQQGGTWYTIGYAEAQNKVVVVLAPKLEDEDEARKF